jgi:hypothetical protein
VVRRRAARKDKNHDDLKEVFEQLGCTVVDMHATGIPGWPDMAVGLMGTTHLVEVKNLENWYGKAGLNANQTAFGQTWRGGQIYVVATPEHVTALVQNWRRG